MSVMDNEQTEGESSSVGLKSAKHLWPYLVFVERNICNMQLLCTDEVEGIVAKAMSAATTVVRDEFMKHMSNITF